MRDNSPPTVMLSRRASDCAIRLKAGPSLEENSEAETAYGLERKAPTMSAQQLTGMALCLVGLAALIVSVSIGWALSRSSRVRPVASASVISVTSVVLLLAGMVACYFGVNSLVEG